MSGRLPAVAALLVISALAACAPAPKPPNRLTLTPVTFDALPGWNHDHQSAALAAFVESCAALADRPVDRAVGPDAIGGVAGDWRGPCSEAARIPAGDDTAARSFFERRFEPFLAGNNGEQEGLFTGYYEPELRGALQRGGAYTVPLLKRPPDLVMVDLGQFRPAWRGERIAGQVENGRLQPYPTRAEIVAGALAGRGLELAWVRSRADAFFLQIQGSGRILLPDGAVMRVGYDGQNGRDYVAIGRLLVERGAIAREDVSMQSIRAWLAAHPAEAPALLNENPSYVFFRELGGDRPIGAEGVPLSAGRSLAVDRAFLPLGAPVWLDAADPAAPGGRLQRLLVAQDTGGAIRGPVRGDVFWGHGAEAARRAGMMKARGAYYLLLPREVARRGAPTG